MINKRIFIKLILVLFFFLLSLPFYGCVFSEVNDICRSLWYNWPVQWMHLPLALISCGIGTVLLWTALNALNLFWQQWRGHNCVHMSTIAAATIGSFSLMAMPQAIASFFIESPVEQGLSALLSWGTIAVSILILNRLNHRHAVNHHHEQNNESS